MKKIFLSPATLTINLDVFNVLASPSKTGTEPGTPDPPPFGGGGAPARRGMQM